MRPIMGLPYCILALAILSCQLFNVNGMPKGPKTGLCMMEKMRARPRTSLQTQNYISLVHDSDVFVDKSLFIKEIMEDKNRKILVNCPRKWGKTILLNMIQNFFEIQVNETGDRILPIESTSNYQLFVHGNVTRKGKQSIRKLKIAPRIGQDKEFVDKYLGRHPVISLDIGFLQLNPGLMWIMKGVLQQITEAYEDHMYLRTVYQTQVANKTHKDAIEKLAKYNKHIDMIRRMPAEEAAQGLLYLSKLLYEHFKAKVIMVMDVYDLSLDSCCGDTWFVPEERAEFLKFYEDLMEQTINKNEYLEKVVIAGIQFPPEPFMNSIFQDTTICNVITGNYMEYFGFNQWDMQLLWEFHNTTPDVMKEMNEWYGGYKVNGRNVRIYQPWSVVHSLRRKRIEWFWARTYDIQLTVLNFCELDTFVAKFHQLTNLSQITVQLKTEFFSYRDWAEVSSVFLCTEDAPLHGDVLTDRGLFVFFMHGYLTLAQDYNRLKDKNKYHLKFPNREVLETMKHDFHKFLKQGPQRWTGVDIP